MEAMLGKTEVNNEKSGIDTRGNRMRGTLMADRGRLRAEMKSLEMATLTREEILVEMIYNVRRLEIDRQFRGGVLSGDEGGRGGRKDASRYGQAVLFLPARPVASRARKGPPSAPPPVH